MFPLKVRFQWERSLLVMVEQLFQLEEEEQTLELGRSRRRAEKERGEKKECAL